MMRPDIKIVIAWSGEYQKQAAQMLYDKLTAYIKTGYPISVSFINEQHKNEIILDAPVRDGGKSDSVRIAEKMETYFSNFDYAFFFFDIHTHIKINEEAKKVDTPILSANLTYEYGLASSSFINRSKEKKIFCFSPSKINEETLQYINGIDLKLYNIFPHGNGADMDKQTDYIIKHFIHENILLKDNLFYGLPSKLPKLTKQNDEYVVTSQLSMTDPMDLSNNNMYWADLKKLQPTGIMLSLENQGEPLNEVFVKEYKQFDDVASEKNHSESILGRRLLYIIDRAVFIMYLRQEDYWNDKAKELYSARVKMLPDKSKINDDYYIKSIQALQGVFMYQQYSRPKNKEVLFNKLKEIEKLLKPASKIGHNIGNRMIYCMAADYLALVYHKQATKEFGKIIGKTDFYFDNKEHIDLLQRNLQKPDVNTQIKQVIGLYYKAALMFKKVVDCQTKFQVESDADSPKYIWKSYALYNQARCEFAIHLILILSKSKGFEKEEKIAVSWHTDLYDAANYRKQDYIYFDNREKLPLFPQIITFNMRAEYYHAFYEYELYALIEKQINTSFETKDLHFPIDNNFQEWKEKSLIITDVLSVDDKVKRLKGLKTNYIQNLVPDKKLADKIANIINNDTITEKDKTELVNTINLLELSQKNKLVTFLLKNGGDIIKSFIGSIFANLIT